MLPNFFKYIVDEMITCLLAGEILKDLARTIEGDLSCNLHRPLLNIELLFSATDLRSRIKGSKSLLAVRAVEPGASQFKRPLRCLKFLSDHLSVGAALAATGTRALFHAQLDRIPLLNQMLKTRAPKILSALGQKVAQIRHARPSILLKNDHQLVQKLVELFVHGVSKPLGDFGFVLSPLLCGKIKYTRWLHATSSLMSHDSSLIYNGAVEMSTDLLGSNIHWT
jgi:hypothetical protein